MGRLRRDETRGALPARDGDGDVSIELVLMKDAGEPESDDDDEMLWTESEDLNDDMDDEGLKPGTLVIERIEFEAETFGVAEAERLCRKVWLPAVKREAGRFARDTLA